jgi:hypothetical protein
VSKIFFLQALPGTDNEQQVADCDYGFTLAIIRASFMPLGTVILSFLKRERERAIPRRPSSTVSDRF